MRIIVIGAVAAGTSAAAKARRNNDDAEITIYERDVDISYSGCGLPYYIGNEIVDIEALTPRNPAFFKKKYNIDVKTLHEVVAIDPKKKVVNVRNLQTLEVFEDTYDKLVIATGASSFIPAIEGREMDHVFSLRNVQDARNIKSFIKENRPQNVVIAGTGFIGFELLENLMNYEMNVTIVELMDKITPNLDEDMATYLENKLEEQEVKLKKSSAITGIRVGEVEINKSELLKADMVILATGVKANTQLAVDAGVELGRTGAIKVDKQMATSIADIYACGDCIETFSAITNKPVYRPLGSTANKTGRIAGDVITGGRLSYRGNLSTGIFKLFDMTIATTGLSEKEAIEDGYEVVMHHNIKPDRPFYYYGKEMLIKSIADKNSGRLLGVQIIGEHGVDKRIDVFATLITYEAKVEDLFHLDLAYAPPFSTTKDPVHYTGMVLDNAINSDRTLITEREVRASEEPMQIIDARSNKDYSNKGHVEDAKNIPHAVIRDQLDGLDPTIKTVTYCNKGVTGNAVQNILLNKGFKDVSNLSGGHRFYNGTKNNNK